MGEDGPTGPPGKPASFADDENPMPDECIRCPVGLPGIDGNPGFQGKISIFFFYFIRWLKEFDPIVNSNVAAARVTAK